MKKFLAGFGIAAVVLSVLAWTPTDRNFNRNQFGTNSLSINIKSGATTTNLLHYGSNYFGGPVYHGGGNGVAYFTNGFVLFDSVEQYLGDYIMIEPGSEFIGTHRGDGQYLTNIPQAGVSGLKSALETTNATVYARAGDFVNLLLPEGPGGDAVLRIGDFFITANGQTLDFSETTGPTSIFDYDVASDTFRVQEKVLISEQLTVSTGQDGEAIIQHGGGTNFFDASTYFQSNVFARSLSPSNVTASTIAGFTAARVLTNITIGSGLSFDGVTLSATGGGGGSDTNGISYANVAWPAFGTTGNAEAWLKYTNGVKAITAINDGANSKLVITNIAGDQMADFDINGYIALDITEYDGTPVLTKANNVRVLADGNGTAAIDFSSATEIQINGIVLNTPSWDIGEFLWVDGSGQVSGTSNLPLASLTVTGNAVVEGQVIGNGQGITNLIYAPNTVTLFETNTAILTNCVSFLTVTNHVRFTNWASVAVAGQWFNVFLTNSTGNDYYIDVPTNGFTRNMTNSTGSYVVADASGTNFACLLTNGQRARLVGEFVGGNLNAATFYFRHW